MQHKERYTLVEDDDVNRLIEEVNDLIIAGWVPLGGISTAAYVDSFWYTQAMWRPK